MSAHLGVIGLGTMGANLARNAARHGATVSVFNRTEAKTHEFIAAHGAEGAFTACKTLQSLVESLPKPRAILLMVSAGSAVDLLIEELLPLVEPGDILIDAGNSFYRDTERREKLLKKSGIRFVGMGVSGGEQGALEGPSMMPGGEEQAVKSLLPLLTSMAAQDGEGGACVAWMGPGGAGHFVKMVHNGIEYGVMQLIAEAVAILQASGASHEEVAATVASWHAGDLQSYLMEITAAILPTKDPETGSYLIDVIRDVAGQKGTGRWTVESAAEYGSGIPTITAGVEARMLSAAPEERARRSKTFPSVLLDVSGGTKDIAAWTHDALRASTLAAYSQGFDLLAKASAAEQWSLPFGEIARIWRGGCIIRSPLLSVFQQAFMGSQEESKRQKLAIIDRFSGEIQRSWRSAVTWAFARGIPVPAMAASLAYYDAIRSVRLPQSVIQAQRDYFGAHGYERTDKPGTFHTHW